MENKKFSVSDFIEEVNKTIENKKEVTRGNIELFRSKLREYNLLNDRESLEEKHIVQYKQSYDLKKNKNMTWEDSFDAILSEDNKSNIIIKKFYFDSSILINDLIWRIKKEYVEVMNYFEYDNGIDNDMFHFCFDVIINNYYELKDVEPRFKNSFGTDGNPILSYFIKGYDYSYITIGKLNHFTNEEEIHVYYNEGKVIHPLRMNFLGYGSTEKGIFKELNDILRQSSKKNINKKIEDSLENDDLFR